MSKQVFTEGMTGAELVNYLNLNFTQLYNNSIVNAKDYGFLPSASAAVNTAALQAAILGGNKTVFIDYGIYEVDDTILIDSNTVIIAPAGFKMKKMATYCQVFLNRGALTKEYNENIIIDGLEIIVNGKETSSVLVPNMRCHLGFYYIKNLKLINYKSLDGGSFNFNTMFIHFENIYVNNFQITSLKDGFSLQNGHNIIFDTGILETQDDAIGVKCIDFPSLLVEVGDIYDITIINTIDRTPNSQSEGGYFARLMTASWDNWTNGNIYKAGEICLNEGKLYQVNNTNFSHTASSAPTHTNGVITGADTISWKYLNISSIYSANIYNLKIINHKQEKKRSLIASNIYIDNAINLTAATPGTEDHSFVSNIKILNSEITPLTGSCHIVNDYGNLKNIILSNNIMDSVVLYYNNGDLSFTRSLFVTLSNNSIKSSFGLFTDKMAGHSIVCQTSGNIQENLSIGNAPSNGATIRMNGIDLPLKNGDLTYLTPVVGDIVRYYDGLMIYKSEGWVNLAI